MATHDFYSGYSDFKEGEELVFKSELYRRYDGYIYTFLSGEEEKRWGRVSEEPLDGWRRYFEKK